MIINNNKNTIHKSRIGYKNKHSVAQIRVLNNKPSAERNLNDISFKGGFSIAGLKKAFAPYIKKSHNLQENLELLEKYVGKAPSSLNAETIKWPQIGEYLKRNNNGQIIEISEKNWPTLIWEGIIYPIKELPLHIAEWAKNLVTPKTKQKAEGIFETLNNTDIVNSMSGYMESAAKYKHDSAAIQSSELFTKAMKMFDPKSGNYNGVHERALTRVVTGLIPAYFLANDAYNLSRLCDDDPKEAEKERKLRFNQEIKRVMSNAYLQLITLGALSKFINKSTWSFVGVTALTVLITEAFSRLSNGKKIHFISQEEAVKINEKEAKKKNKNSNDNTTEVTNVSKSKPGFKGANVFETFGIVSQMPFETMNIATFTEKLNEENNKELKPLLTLPVIAKWFVGTIALGIAFKHGKNIKIGASQIKLGDYLNVISKKYDALYNKLTQKDFKIANTEFKQIINKLRQYDDTIASKIEEIALNSQRTGKIKKEALEISKILKESGLNDLAEIFEHLNNQKLNKTFKDIPLYNKATKFFKERENAVIANNLEELFKKLETAGLKEKAEELKSIIITSDGKVNTGKYKEAYKYVKSNINEYLSTFENRFKVDTDAEIRKLFANAMESLESVNLEKATELRNAVENSVNAEYINFGKQNIKGVREFADFVTEPFKFIWGTITLPYKHVAKKVLELNKTNMPKWAKENEAVKNIITKLRQKPMFTLNHTPMIERSNEELAAYMNKQINKGFNTATMSSISNSDLSALAKNTSTAATIWFLMADNHNMVMLKSNGKDKKNATLKAKERLVQETSRTFYNVMFINLFNNTFRSLFNSSLIGAQVVNTMSTVIGENANRKMIGVPVGQKTRDEILEADRRHLEDEGIKGDFFRFMSRLTGKKALTLRENKKK